MRRKDRVHPDRRACKACLDKPYEAPAVFLWRHQMAWGLSKSIEYAPEVNGYIYGTKIHVTGGKSK